MAKRTGLGRGIGALIPTSEGTQSRPVDVFFPDSPVVNTQDPAPARRSSTAKATAASAAAAASAIKEKSARGTAKSASKTSVARSAPTKAASTKATTTNAAAPNAAETAPVAAKSPAPKSAAAKPKPAKTDSPSTVPGAAIDVSQSESAATESDVALLEIPGLRLVQLDPNEIVPNPRQPRTHFDQEHLAELVHSVREFGVMQPVVVRAVDGGYELIMGERRTRAAREAGLTSIPAIVRDTADEDMLRDALLENLHRSQLNPLEEASAYQQLLDDFSITHEELAQRIGRSRPQISNTLRLLKLPVGVQQRVAAGVLSAGHARAILSLDDSESMIRLADKVVNEDLSVRAAEAAAKQIQASGGASEPRATAPLPGARRAYLDDVASRLGDRLNTRVKVTLGARKGQMSVEFASIQDLNRILRELGESDLTQG